MEYKSVEKYLNKYNKKKENKYFYKFFIRLCISLVIILVALIGLKYDKNTNQVIYKYLNDKNINMASINKWYKNHFGDITPFQSITKDSTKLVFNESLTYSDIKNYVMQTPSLPPLLYQFRQRQKNKWVGKADFQLY